MLAVTCSIKQHGVQQPAGITAAPTLQLSGPPTVLLNVQRFKGGAAAILALQLRPQALGKPLGGACLRACTADRRSTRCRGGMQVQCSRWHSQRTGIKMGHALYRPATLLHISQCCWWTPGLSSCLLGQRGICSPLQP